MSSALTLMAVHAHPDDEASTTGGILAKYSDEGIRTVLVTCTNGEMGDGPDGTKPGERGHDEELVAALRRRELEASRRALGVRHLVCLGYRDSGMAGWPSNDAPNAFSNLDVESAAAPLVDIMRRYRPDVVVTYDDFGFYGHPDHIQAHRITLAALDATGLPAKLYFPAVRRSRLPAFRERMVQAGLEPPSFDDERFGSPDELIAATVDCRDHAHAKLAALQAHASQGENLFFLRFGITDFTEIFGVEEFVRARGHGPTPEDDLFAGLRERITRGGAQTLERISARRRISASAGAVYDVISQPRMHVEIDGSAMLVAASGVGRLTAIGDGFDMEMDREPLGDRPTGRYMIHNTVTKIVTGQVLEWSVAVAGEQPAGHVWGYEITEIGPHESEVTLYCDWTAVADVRLRSQFPFVPPSMMRLSLENLERIVLPQGVRAIRPHAVTLVTP